MAKFKIVETKHSTPTGEHLASECPGGSQWPCAPRRPLRDELPPGETLPHGLTSEQFELDPSTVANHQCEELDVFFLISQALDPGQLDPPSSERVLDAALQLFRLRPRRVREQMEIPSMPGQPWPDSLVFAACLDTALVWELG